MARREGLEVAEVIEELDASGGNRKRPGWNRAIAMVESGEVDGVAVWNLARFSRSVKDAPDALERIEGAGGKLNLRRILGPEKHAEAAANYVAVVNKCEADLAEARERNTGSCELVGRASGFTSEAGPKRKEWVERMVRSVVVSRGREPLSRRVEVELR